MVIANKVKTFLDNDFVIRKALSKNIISLRALSRYLCDTLGLDQKNIHAVMSALRRYKKEDKTKRDKELRNVFSKLTIKTRSNIVDICIAKNRVNQENLNKFNSKIDVEKGDVLRMIQAEQGIRLITDEKNLDLFYDIFGKKYLSLEKGLTEINIQFTKEAAKVSGIVSLITSSLSSEDINLAEIISSAPELLVFIKNSDLLKALQVINNIKDNI